MGSFHLPDFPVPEGETLESYLRRVTHDGLDRRLVELRRRGSTALEEMGVEAYRERLARELDVIQTMGFAGYFLIVWDFVRHARENDVPVGPGRGSAAGSLVSYVLGITDIDPLQYDLLFERFLNPERISMPDIDIDFCMRRRGEIIEYVGEKYGRDRVAQIITFGTLGAKAVIRDVGRVLGLPYGKVDRVAKLVPDMTRSLEDALESVPALCERRSLEIRRSTRCWRSARASRARPATLRSTPPASSSRRAPSTSWCRSTRRARTRSSPSGTWTSSRTSASSRWTSWACAPSPSSTTR